MALAKIREGKLEGREYVKYDYDGNKGHYPRITRKWTRVPIEVLYCIESRKDENFDIHYEVGEESNLIKEELDKQADEEIDKILETEAKAKEEKKKAKTPTKKKIKN